MREIGLPRGWVNETIPELISDEGLFADGDWVESKDQDENGDVRLIQLADIGVGDFRNKSSKYLTSSKAAELKCTYLQKGDILIARMPDPLGRACIFPLSGKNVTVVDVAIVRLGKNSIEPKWLMHIINSPQIQSDIVALASGSTRLRISRSNLSTISFPIPPLAEQKRIVAKLERAFAHFENIRIRWSNISSLQKRLIEQSLTNPINGQYYPKGKLIDYLEEGTKRIGDDWRGVRKVGVSAQKGIIDLDTGQKTTFENYKIVYPGDFVYNAMRVNIGSIAQYNGNEIAITSPDYIVFRVKEHLSPRLLLGFLKSPTGLSEINNNTKGSVRSRLYFKSLANINYPIAPEQTQRQAENILQWFATAAEKWEGISKLLDNFSKAILSKAFSGELTEQSVNDESAALLLQNVKKNRNQTTISQKEKQKTQNSRNSSNKVNMNLEEQIRGMINKSKFVFEDIKDLFDQNNYEDHKNDFFELIKNERIIMSYNPEKKTQEYTLKVDA